LHYYYRRNKLTNQELQELKDREEKEHGAILRDAEEKILEAGHRASDKILEAGHRVDEITGKENEKLLVPENKMGVLPIGKLLFTMSLPPMISMIINSLYNIIDSICVAQVSENALAAVTLVFPVQMLIISIMVGISVGLSSLIARRLGEKRQADADSAAAHGFVIAIVAWAFFALFAIFIAPLFLGLYTEDPEILDGAILYCRIVMIGSLPMCIAITIERILQATGNMIFPMIFNATGAIINAILAPIFIIGLLGAPALGIMGAGIVAVFGQSIAMIIAIILFVANEHAVTVKFKGFRCKGEIIKDIFAVGAPTIVMMSIQSFLITGLNAILISYSTTAVAVLGIYYRIQTFVVMPVIGMNQGALPLMGYNFGAKKKARLLEVYHKAIKVAFIIMLIGVALFWVFPREIMSMFAAGPEMMDMGVHALRAISVSFFFAPFVIITIGLFQALAHGAYAMIISIIRQLGMILPAAYILVHLFGVNGAWYAFPVAEGTAFVLALLFRRRIMRKEIDRLPG
jgi:putative MATE family efflux protein